MQITKDRPIIFDKVRIVVIFYIVFFHFFQVNAQNPDQSREFLRAVWMADSFLNQGDIANAISEYKKVYPKYPESSMLLYNYARALAIGNQIDSSLMYLSTFIKLDTTEDILVEPDFNHLRQDKRWTMLEDTVIQRQQRKRQTQYMDIAYARQLWKLRALDQAYYEDIDLAKTRNGENNRIVVALQDLKILINQKNQNMLDSLIAIKGWPKKSAVGSIAANAAFLVVQHSDINKQRKYLPTIESLCAKGEAEWASYALMYDRIQALEGNPQKYGSQVRYNNTTQKYELYQLLDSSKVDVWRHEVGLPPLKEYLSEWELTFP